MFTRNSIVLSNNIKTPLTATNKAIGSNGILKYSYNFDEIIRQIFSHQEQVFAYDPNDLTTLYQDAAGTIPVTAQGQPVGLMKDKSGRNNHARQTASASRPILQQTPILGAEVILNGSFEVDTTAWTPIWATLSQQLGELKVTNVSGKLDEQAQQRIETRLIPQRLYQLTVSAYKDITATAYAILVETDSATLVSKQLQTNTGKATHTLLFTAPNAGEVVNVRLRTIGLNGSAYFDDVSVKEITGYRTDQNYLEFDGVDDFLQTSNIDFTVTDKVSLFAGVRVMSDTDAGVITELGNGDLQGSFMLFCGGAGGSESYTFASRGSGSHVYTPFTKSAYPVLAAPKSSVVVSKGDISTPLSKLNVDSIYSNISTDNQGTGNYGNHPLYIGRRAGTSFPFNGYLYSLIGIGRLTSGSETKALEKSIAKNTGVTLNV